MKLWSDGKTEDDIEYHANDDSDNVIFNLIEDIKCLKEDNAKLSHRIYEHNCRVIGTPIPPKSKGT